VPARNGSDSTDGPIAKFCADLDELRKRSGRDIRTLALELKISRPQLYAILDGKRKTPPDWDFVRRLVIACGGKDSAVDEWRRRHAVLVMVYEELNRRQRQTPPAADPVPAKPAELVANPPLGATAATEAESTLPRQVPVHTANSGARIDEPSTLDVDRLAGIVSKEWTKEYIARMFNDTRHGLKVSWEAAEPLMSDWETLVEQATSGTGAQKGMKSNAWADNAQELKGSDHELSAVLDRVPTGWLVVLGEPGYGKSMLMLQLVIDLIRQRAPGGPVPVFVPMTTWNPKDDELEEWLKKQLPHDYPILGAEVQSEEGKRTRIADLLARQRIVPILDGLDEMPLVLRRQAVKSLNEAFARAGRPPQLVVTCRTTEYEAIVNAPGEPWNPISGAAAIELQPPDGAEVVRYLSREGKDKRWAGVVKDLADLTVVSPLREALATPLYACLASAIYNPPHHMRGGVPNPEDLRTNFHDSASIQAHLLDEFIPSVYPDERETEEGRAREEKRQPRLLPVERRLMFIASYLEARKSTTLEWWNLEGLAPGWLPAAVVGVVSGIAVGVAAALGTHVGVGIGVGFGIGILIAEAIGLGFRYAWERWDKEGFKRRFATRRPGPGMAGGIIGAVLGGLAAGVAGRYHIGHEPSLFSGIPEGLGIAVGAGATTDFRGGLVGALFGSFFAGYLAAVGLGLPAGIVNGLGAGIAAALAIKYLGRQIPSIGAPVWESQIGIPAGLIVGLVIGLTAWLEVGVIGGIVVGPLIAAAASVPLGMRYSYKELDAVPSPGHALARDASAFRFTVLCAGLATGSVGFIGGAMTSIFEVGAKPHLTDIIRDGLGIGLSAGLVVGLCFGFYHAASPNFRILTWWLACQGKVPWQFRHFLEDAHQRTVLRQTGASYEFRHVILLNRLAARLEEDL
jgi:hypothetical protein